MIRSIHNSKIKYVRSLLNRRKERKEARSFVLEGVRLLEEAYIAHCYPRLVLYCENLSKRGEQVLQHFAAQDVEIAEISKDIMETISNTETSQGLIAVIDEIRIPFPNEINNLLILDGVRDPGNMGTILRTAAASGMQAVLLIPGSADAFNPKVLRAGMGAHFHIPITTMTWDEIHYFLKTKTKPAIALYVSVVRGGKPFWEMDFCQPHAIVIGGEAEGSSSKPQQWADGYVNIPMPGGSESLNAAVAAGVIIFEIIRQRSL
jgi:TrmH family RNA methyltransferase